jgi:hypothetical protein
VDLVAAIRTKYLFLFSRLLKFPGILTLDINPDFYVSKGRIDYFNIHAYGLGAHCLNYRDTCATALSSSIYWFDGYRS